MAQNSKIQWTDDTWNPWHGCIKVSEGCKYCYMYRDKEMYGQDPTWVQRSSDKTFLAPLFWKDRRMVFTCSWSDFFIEYVDPWRDEAWRIIRDSPHLTFQILTKRPERIKKCLPADWAGGYPNVMIGISAENQARFNERLYHLITTPARIRFLSAEPLLGHIEIIKGAGTLDWVIIGGESGNETGNYRYRECKTEWITSLIYQCRELEIPVFVKQLGTSLARKLGLKHRHGGDIDEWNKAYQVREFPKI